MGGFTRSWSDQFYFRGRLSTISISESLSADKATVFMTHKVYCDYNDKFDATWRIALDGTSRTFEIKGVGLPSNQTMGHMELQVKEQV